MTDEIPFHLKGNFAPVKDEVTGTDLEVVGTLPPELTGMYARNTANPVTGVSDHWFLGNGMVHGVRLEGGKAAWYRNRYVQTPLLTNPEINRISELGQIDHKVSAANTHVLSHGGKILALEEGSFPYVLDGKLNTVGHSDFDGKLKTAFTAHPKICPVTGEMLGFGYGQLPPYFVYHRVSADGKLVQSEEIEVGGPTMHHDFAITEKYVIIMDLPVVFDLQLALQGTMPFHWSDDYPARMGLLPRNGTNADVKWFEIDPCYVFHNLNAYDDGDTVVLDSCRMSEVWRNAGQMQGGDTVQTLHRFTFDLASGTTKEETLDDRGMDFPRVGDASVGQRHDYGYTVQFGEGPDGQPAFVGLMKIDFRGGKTETHSFGEGVNGGEPVFVPAAGANPKSDEGWVMSYVHDENSGKTELVLLDASNWTAPPVARVKLPQRVPYGFHGSWMPDQA